MGKSRFIELMAKRMGASATAEELAELELFLQSFPELKKTQEVSDALKGSVPESSVPRAQKDPEKGLDELWEKIRSAQDDPRPQVPERRPLRALRWIAAAAVLVLVSGLLLFNLKRLSISFFSAKRINHTIYVPYGKTRVVLLPDGSRVQLNSRSSFTYPDKFTGKDREVRLRGEGFFEVAHDRRWPFLVHTDKLTVKVLGTVFNVKAYPEDKDMETTLLSGKVQVELNDKPEKKIILLPNEKLIVFNKQGEEENPLGGTAAKLEYQLKKLQSVKAAEVSETAWTSNRLVFINENFDQVAHQMERKYNVQLLFQDPALRREQMSGALENESLENALQIISMTTPFKFRREGRLVYILHK